MNTTTEYGLARINTDQRLYVERYPSGMSCVGFDVAHRWMMGVHSWLVRNSATDALASLDGAELSSLEPGTEAHYFAYKAIMDAGRQFAEQTDQQCDAELTPQLVGLENMRVEVVDRYGEKRRFYVGKSTGWVPCHLEIKTRVSRGGMAVIGTPFQSVRVVGSR